MKQRFVGFIFAALILVGCHTQTPAETSCVATAHFLNHDLRVEKLIGELISLLGNPASFAVADGKARDAMRTLDEEAVSLSERQILVYQRGEMEAYESCGRFGHRACLDAAQHSEDKYGVAFTAVSASLQPCDQAKLPTD